MSPVLAGGFFAGTPGKPLTFLDITKQSPQCIQKLSAATHSFYTFTDHIPEAVQGLLRLISFAAGCVPLDPLLTLPAPHPPPLPMSHRVFIFMTMDALQFVSDLGTLTVQSAEQNKGHCRQGTAAP